MGHVSIGRTTAAIALCCAALCAQDLASSKALRQRFDALPAALQETTLADALRRIEAIEDEALRRVEAYGEAKADFPPAKERAHHSPAEFAPVAPARKRIGVEDPRNKQARTEFPQVRMIRDLKPQVAYDWLHGEPVRAPQPTTTAEQFANLCAGYPPSADRAIARLLAVLDRDADQREVAAWSEHTYADRDGRVFEGITLYEAWCSGRTVEVPDVDAIAFARGILDTHSFVSPIPDGARRERLYAQIRDALKRHREYRTLCESAAATFVAAEPWIDPTYQPMVDRLHMLWAECGHDPDTFGKRMTDSDRSELLAGLDERFRQSGESYDAMRTAKSQKRRLGELVRAACAAALGATDAAGR